MTGIPLKIWGVELIYFIRVESIISNHWMVATASFSVKIVEREGVRKDVLCMSLLNQRLLALSSGASYGEEGRGLDNKVVGVSFVIVCNVCSTDCRRRAWRFIRERFLHCLSFACS